MHDAHSLRYLVTKLKLDMRLLADLLEQHAVDGGV